ncbi:MAG: hypothetical protein LC745_02535 [Planctomycetia bacterium]|nr:hypothetical protein [Planctomycetia bacterium]
MAERSGRDSGATPDTIGGERPLPPSRISSPLLRRHGHSVAAYCVRRCYETWPELDERYGARGRQHAIRDGFWHLEHLDAAASSGEPRIFAEYADWLAGLLEARGIGREQVAGAFGFLAEAIETVAWPSSREAHRAELVAILRENQARVLTPAGAQQS